MNELVASLSTNILNSLLSLWIWISSSSSSPSFSLQVGNSFSSMAKTHLRILSATPLRDLKGRYFRPSWELYAEKQLWGVGLCIESFRLAPEVSVLSDIPYTLSFLGTWIQWLHFETLSTEKHKGKYCEKVRNFSGQIRSSDARTILYYTVDLEPELRDITWYFSSKTCYLDSGIQINADHFALL